MNRLYIRAISLLAIMLSFAACSSDDVDSDPAADPDTESPVGNDLYSGTFDMVVDLSQGFTLQQDTYGVNNSLITQSYYETEPEFTAAYKAMRSPTYRYPGGTVGNYHNCLTGWNFWDDDIYITSATYEKRITSVNESIAKNKTDGHSYIPMCEFLVDTGTELCMQLNIGLMTYDEIKEFFTDIKSRGVSPKYVEMGNELFYSAYQYVVPTVQDYIEHCKTYGTLVKEMFPSAKVGVCIHNDKYTDETFLEEEDTSSSASTGRQGTWSAGILADEDQSFYDAIILHLYADTGMTSSTTTAEFLDYYDAYKNCMSHADKMFSAAIKLYEEEFPGKSVWVTEYHVGGFSGDVTSYRLRYSYLGGLFTSTCLLKLFKNPNVELGSWHNLVQWFEYNRVSNGEIQTDINFNMLVNHNFFGMFADAVRESNMFVDVTMQNCHTYYGTEYSGTFDDIEAGMFYDLNDKQYYIVAINKFNQTYTWDSTTLVSSLSTKVGKVTEVKRLTINDITQLNNTTTEYEDADISTISTLELNGSIIQLPPYSVSVIKIE